MYEREYKQLKDNGIELHKPLDEKTIIIIELIYNIKFPTAYRELLKKGMPKFESEINWYDFSEENIAKIRKEISYLNHYFPYTAEYDSWSESWLDKPLDFNKKLYDYYEIANYAFRRSLHAPKLIPITFDKTYISEISVDLIHEDNEYTIPVFIHYNSIHAIGYKDLKDFIINKVQMNEVSYNHYLFYAYPNIDTWGNLAYLF